MTDAHLEGMNPRQRDAVRLRGNGVVTAGAGAGKTSVLAARYLDLCINDGLQPDQILALTFTRKAAAEMFDRIHSKLAGSADPGAARALAGFADARITTLDSFCAGIVRGSAADYGYPPDFTVDESTCREIAGRCAMEFVLERRSEPGLRELLAAYRLETVAEGFFASMAARLVRPSADDRDIFSPMRDAMRSELARLAKQKFGALDARAAEALEVSGRLTTAGADCREADIAFAAWRGLRGRQDHRALELPEPAVLREAADAAGAFTGLKMRSYGKDEAQAAMKVLARAARDELSPIIPQLAETADFLPSYDLLMGLAAEYASRVRQAKRAASVMDFADLGACAVETLERRRDIRRWWQRKIRSIMIDEFQDDNELQKRLLFLLAEHPDREGGGMPGPGDLEPGKLFFVGDEKQSIYLFRGADVSVFRGLARELGESGDGTCVTLDRNYRSTPDLVAFFNGLFPNVMADARADHEARYEPMTPGVADPGFGSRIEYRIMRRAGGSAKRDAATERALAADIAAFIGESVRDGLPVRGEDGSVRPATYRDFAVLIRSGSRQHHIETALRNRGIPFDASDPRGLFSEAAAFDLHSALKLALDPSDRHAYAALLRSPAVRLPADAFARVMAEGEAPFEFSGKHGALADRDMECLERGRNLLGGIRERLDLLPHAELLEWIWHTGGFRLSLAASQRTRPFAEHFEFLRHLAAKADTEGRSAWEFVAGLEPLMGSYDRLDLENVVRDSVDGVRIMTIHKSKGLEFPVVLVPGMESTGRTGGTGSESGDIWRLLPDAGVTVNLKAYDDPEAKAANVFHGIASELDTERERAEIKRLFYVACTRAADHLVFFGLEPDRADNAGSSFHTLLMGAPDKQCEREPGLLRIVEVEPLPGNEYGNGHENGHENGRVNGGGKSARMADFYRKAALLEHPAPRPSVSVSALAALHLEAGTEQDSPGEREESGEHTRPGEPGEPGESGLPAAAFGTLCHALIAHRTAILRGAPDKPFVPDGNLFPGAPGSLEEKAIAEASLLSDGFFASELWRDIAGMERVESEKPFILCLGEAPLVEGRIDLFAETRDPGRDRIVIVDFKTDREPDRSLHELQLALYRKAARALAPEARVESHIFWLRNGASSACTQEYGDEYLRSLACGLR